MTQGQLDQWNEFHPVGSPCSLKLDDGSEILTRIRSEAWVTGSGHALVKVEGKAGGWSLDRVRMLETHVANTNP